MKIVTLSGWGQDSSSLDTIIPPESNKIKLDYSVYPDFEAFKTSIGGGIKSDVVIGWSLGGLIAMKLLSEGIIQTKLLVLLASPFQFVSDDPKLCGIPQKAFDGFVSEYQADAKNMLSKFKYFLVEGDKNKKTIIDLIQVNMHPEALKNGEYWLRFLAQNSAADFDLSSVPKTILIHGENDAVTPVGQSDLLHQHIKNSILHQLKNCGHVPHLHDPKLVMKCITMAAI